MEITELNPKIVWKYFHEITQVPRPSKKEGKIIAYLEKFAKEHGIDVDRRKISLKSEVTGAGEYEAVIKVHPEIQSTIRVLVVAE